MAAFLSPKAREAVRVYKEMKANIDHMGKSVLEMLRHPDATPDQIDTARQVYFSAYQSWIQARVAILKRYPQTREWLDGR